MSPIEGVAVKIKAIRTKKDYDEALAGIERLMGARPNTSDGDRLEALAALVQAYEARRFIPRVEHASTFLKRLAGKDPLGRRRGREVL